MGTHANNPKLALFGFSCLILAVVGSAAPSKAVESICSKTDYKETCVKNLEESGVGNSVNPKDMIKAGFNATIKFIKEAAAKSETLKQAEQDPMAKQALDICKRLMGFAVDELEVSIDRLGKFDLTKVDDALEDLNIWLSAVSTYQETCLDGFNKVNTTAGRKMRSALSTSMELTTNALTMIDEINSILGDLGLPMRRLLTDDENLPKWMDPLKRKLLAAPALPPNVVVAQDGSGKYKTVTEALKDIPPKGTQPFVIRVKAGIYNEKVTFDKTMTNVVLIGDGPTKTKITNNKNFADGTQTFDSATVST